MIFSWDDLPGNLLIQQPGRYALTDVIDYWIDNFCAPPAIKDVILNSKCIESKWVLTAIKSAFKQRKNIVQFWLSEGGVFDVPSPLSNPDGSTILMQFRSGKCDSPPVDIEALDLVDFGELSRPVEYRIGNDVAKAINDEMADTTPAFADNYLDFISLLFLIELSDAIFSQWRSLPSTSTPIYVLLTSGYSTLLIGTLDMNGWMAKNPLIVIDDE